MRAPSLITLSLALACSGSLEPRPEVDERTLDVRIQPLEPAYRPGDPAVARIINHSAHTVYDNLCAGQTEGYQESTGEWVPLSGRACIQYTHVQPRPIPPGAVVEDTLFLSTRSFPGQWRFRLDIRDADGDQLPEARLVSEPFEVEP